MNERSILVHKYYNDASEKFDYFVLGLIVAVIAYFAQNIKFGEIGCNVSTVYLLSILVFILSAIAAFKRIEYSIELHRLNHLELDAIEHNELERAESARVPISSVVDLGSKYYRVRNISMLIGVACFIAGKILDAYTIT